MCAEVFPQGLHRVGQAPQFPTDFAQPLAQTCLALKKTGLTVAQLGDLAIQVVAEPDIPTAKAVAQLANLASKIVA